jgi:uncharacterized DUF497 family protein
MAAKHGVAPTEANEAVADLQRVILDPDPSSISGKGIRVVGQTSNGRLLSVLLLNMSGVLYGVNGWDANARDARIYNHHNRKGGQ